MSGRPAVCDRVSVSGHKLPVAMIQPKLLTFGLPPPQSSPSAFPSHLQLPHVQTRLAALQHQATAGPPVPFQLPLKFRGAALGPPQPRPELRQRRGLPLVSRHSGGKESGLGRGPGRSWRERA